MRGAGAKVWAVSIVAVIVVSRWWNTPPADTVTAPGSPSRGRVEELLGLVTVVASRPHPGGYDRGCEGAQRCVFGPAWSDDHPGPEGHDGCDTRNDVLAVALREVVFRPGSGNCIVVSGELDDPYTGAHIPFRRADAAAVHIDHIFPLAAAWDHGASGWSPELRRQFANDVVYNLLAVDGPTNLDKSDHTPAEWLPPAAGRRCWYAGRYLTVAVRYSLTISIDDHRALAAAATTCPP